MEYYVESIDQWGTDHTYQYWSRDDAERGAVKLLRDGAVQVRLCHIAGRVFMVLTQAQLHLFKDWQV